MKKNESLIKQIQSMGMFNLFMPMRDQKGNFVMYVLIDVKYACDMLNCQQDNDKTEFFLGTCPNGDIYMDCK